MAETETTTATPNEAQPVAEAAPVEQSLTAVEPDRGLLEVVEILAEPETEEEAAAAAETAAAPKQDGPYEPLGNVVNRP
ncbi:hypothetical protein GCM10020229_19940 [Kitasatospora albolonga]|uniref:hypothetical protein n=1 Tax=Kitasatospora albolonga TaxID=68173 RepID=UPI0031F04B69